MASFTISQLPGKQASYTLANSDLLIMSLGTSTPFVSTAKITLNELESYFETVSGGTNVNGLRGASSWTTLNSNSAEYESAFTVVGSNSSNWSTGYTNSIASQNSIVEVAAVSSNWDATYTDFKANSGKYVVSYTTSVSSFPSSGTVQRFSHVQTGTPGIVRGVIVCTSAELGYSVNDEVDLVHVVDSADDRSVAQLTSNTVYISAIFNYTGSPSIITGDGATRSSAITLGSWDVKVYHGHTL